MNIYRRDHFKCQGCGDSTGGNLHAHHLLCIKELIRAAIKEQPDMKPFDACMCYQLFFRTTNGITVCTRCHKKIHKRIIGE